ncbi:Radical SAM domain protein [Thermovirga lienii DSM 17291]|uniref:Radical SAM domain protein n=1 Tax=Thermovirga lienii (strain ATCC BAA-1197 / DSM 17291 / Cas60314) TaxID=580340 RepID=G7VA70_THELD|nr:radical SAM protein [Thermovirga lienii]AER66770.1 Radical SAM domain protein [Thermovirga lienii DSM 17291]HCD71479.1 radical SAM protein [Thermovirga lienii]
MRPKALLLDGYVDEPACFGVPPYISPYVRYVYGVLSYYNFDIRYETADSWRKVDNESAIKESQIIVIVAGMTVPGRYRGGSPITLSEIKRILSIPRKGVLFMGGPILHGYSLKGGTKAIKLDLHGVDCLCYGDIEAVLGHFLKTNEIDPCRKRTYDNDFSLWASLGAEVVIKHPWYPWIIAEIELSRGCDRLKGHCSFCSEGTIKKYEERPIKSISQEVKALYQQGVKAFRLGRCANILAFGGTKNDKGIMPNPNAIEDLYLSIRTEAPDLEVLHTDNCNPLSIVNYPDEAASALEKIATHNTEGDVLSLGLENLDPKVAKLNNLKVDYRGALFAVQLINQIGNHTKRPKGLPALLPGLNFLYGLPGEDRESLDINKRFLEELIYEGLAVRRINIRQVIGGLEGTYFSQIIKDHPSKIKEREFHKWKDWVRKEVDPVFLKRVAPTGTIIKDVKIEEINGHICYGRPLGSYPLLVGVIAEGIKEGDVIPQVLITEHGRRSVTGVPCPIRVNSCSIATYEALPGIGRSRAKRLLLKRPFTNFEEVCSALDDPSLLEPYREELDFSD